MAARFTNTTGQTYTSTASVPTGALTITCWVQLVSDINTYAPFWSLDNNTSNAADLLCTTSSDGVGLRLYGVTAQLDGLDMTVGTWYRIAVTKDSARSVVLYYGAAGSTLTASTPTTYEAITPTTLRVGGFRSGVATNSPDARVADFKQWSTNLTAAEVETELSQSAPSRLANLTRWHPFLNAETVDYSGAALTLSGGTGVTTEAGPPNPWLDLTPDTADLPAAVVTATRPPTVVVVTARTHPAWRAVNGGQVASAPVTVTTPTAGGTGGFLLLSPVGA